MRIVFAYATGRIDRRTYKRLTENRIPPSVPGVHLLYATYQISRRQRDYYLRELDEGGREKRELKRALREEKRAARAATTEDLVRKGLVSNETAKDILSGKTPLSLIR